MNALELLQKSIADGEELLRKSQLMFDFSGGAKHDHHKEYVRVNKRGTASHIKAKGSPTEHPHPIAKHADKLKQDADEHERDFPGDAGTAYMMRDAAREMKAGLHDGLKLTLKNADNYQREKILERIHPDHWEGLGVEAIDKDRSIKEFDKKHPTIRDGIDNYKDDVPPEERASYLHGESQKLRDDAPDPRIAELVAGVEKGAAGVLANPALKEHAPEINQMVAELKQHPSAKHAKAVLERILELAKPEAEKLQKSHVKAYTRTSKSGAAVQVKEHEDSRQIANKATLAVNEHHKKADLSKKEVAHQVAKEHADAGHKHIAALRDAKDNTTINEHNNAASHHFMMHDVTKGFHRGSEKERAKENTEHAEALSKVAFEESHKDGEHRPGEKSQDINKRSALHMLAMEQHQRAERAHIEVANKNYGTAEGKAATETAMHHRQEAQKHGKEVQHWAGIAIKARDDAYKASEKADKTGKAEDHKAAAMAHSKAAQLDYDEEGQKEHKQKFDEHFAKVTEARDKEKEDRRQGKPAHADANRKEWDDLPDEENPRYAVSGLSSKHLGQIATGTLDAKHHAKRELAARGQDNDGKWIGFDKAAKHHKVNMDDPTGHDNDLGDHLQTVHSKVLGAIAAGHTDPKRLASEELSSRGHDTEGKWIGFEAAAKLHKTKDKK